MFLHAITLLVVASAAVEERSVRLEYVVDRGVRGCPDVSWVQQAVGARLGYEPFRDDASSAVRARIFRDGTVLRATLEKEGRASQKTFVSTIGDCPELASALELAISIAVDPQVLVREPRARETATPVHVEMHVHPAEQKAARATIPAKAFAPWRWSGNVALHAGQGLVPGTNLAADVGVAARRSFFSVGTKLRTQLSSKLTNDLGTLWPALAVFSPCFHHRALAFCSVTSVGAMQLSGRGGVEPRHESSFLALTGARAEFSITLQPRLQLVPFVEAQAILTRTTIYSGDAVLFTTSPLLISGGTALSFEFSQ